MAHAKFSPSSAHRWMACAGSFAFESHLPAENHSSTFADEGTAAHLVAAECLLHNYDAVQYVGRYANVVKGEVTLYRTEKELPEAGNACLIDDDFANHLQVYLDYVRHWVAQGYQLLVEQKVIFSEAIGIPDQFGTGDAILISADGEHVVVVDLKFGRGVKVYADKNAQALTYGVGTLETFGMLGDFKRFTLAIAQPRLDHLDEWEVTLAEILEHANQLKYAAVRCLNATAQLGMVLENVNGAQEVFDKTLHPGEKQCQWCPVKGTCPALRQWVSSTVFNDFQVLEDEDKVAIAAVPQAPMHVKKLGVAYNALALVEKWVLAVRIETERRVFAGEFITGSDGLPLRLAEGRKGHRVWTDEGMVEAVLVGFLSPDKFLEPRQLVSPSAIDKILNKKATKAQWKILEPFIKQPPGKVKVVLGSDPAPPYFGEAKMDEFADLDDPSL